MVACKIFESDLDFSSLKNPGQIEAPNGTEGAKGEALLFLKAVKAILYGSGYYDRTDAMIDYFDTAWYVNCQLGDYPNGKPYIYKKAKKPKNSRVPVL